MTYQEWANTHKEKRDKLVAKLSDLSVVEIVDYFDYDNMVIKETDFCGLYKDNTKCHDIKGLNCYNCGCPHFIYDDNGLEVQDGITVFSKCNINAKEGSQFKSEAAIHQDCSNCTIPHTKTSARNEIIKGIT